MSAHLPAGGGPFSLSILRTVSRSSRSSAGLAPITWRAKPAELRELRETVRKMLKENGPPPAGKWADIAVLEPVRDYKARHASTMLTFDAVVSALDQIDAKRSQKQAAE